MERGEEGGEWGRDCASSVPDPFSLTVFAGDETDVEASWTVQLLQGHEEVEQGADGGIQWRGESTTIAFTTVRALFVGGSIVLTLLCCIRAGLTTTVPILTLRPSLLPCRIAARIRPLDFLTRLVLRSRQRTAIALARPRCHAMTALSSLTSLMRTVLRRSAVRHLPRIIRCLLPLSQRLSL